MAEIIRNVMTESSDRWSVLIVTNNAMYVEQYFSRLKNSFGASFRIEAPSNKKVLAELICERRIVLISSAQRLIYRRNETPVNEKQIFSESQNLIVIMDEVKENYFSYTYSAIRKSFSNSVFLGMTNFLQDDKRINLRFGPLLYRYSFEQAYNDGILSSFEYQDLTESPLFSVIASEDTKLGAMSEYIARICKKEKKAMSLLLCRNYIEGVRFYKQLKELLPDIKIKLQIRTLNSSSVKNSVDIDDYWDGSRFSGIVVACFHPAVYCDFDIVFLTVKMHEHSLAHVLGKLARPGYDNNYRLLVDFANGQNVISKYIPAEGAMLQTPYEEVQEETYIEELIYKLSEALESYEFDVACDTADRLCKLSPEVGDEIAEQLAFLNRVKSEKANSNASEIKWKSDLWCLLSEYSRYKCLSESENEISEDIIEMTEENEPIPEENAHKTPQQAGECLEKAVLELIKEILSLDDETACLPEYIRRQGAGTQFGFDITFSYKDSYGVDTTYMIECKNYLNNRIRQEDVTPKLVALQQTGQNVDHWILISPNGKLTNELWQMHKEWNESQKWLPIRDVQFWTVEHGVDKLFALFPELYAQFYSSENPLQDEIMNEEKRREAIAYWRQKFAPVPILAKSWREYLCNPQLMLTQCEADIATARQYKELYKHHVPMRVLDKDELPLDGTAEENFMRWLKNEKVGNALLVGDFGDGKTFFTYTFSRHLACQFLKSPETGWIPLRLSLNDFNGNRMDCRDFLYRRLREFDATLKDMREAQERYRFLIILDGFDEMSSSMTDTAISDNIYNLRELTEQFKGHKILVTSRKMALYSDNIYRRVCNALNSPQIFHLAPVTSAERLTYLNEMANTQTRRFQLARIQNTHDLMELAAKPLFLDMMQVLLDESSDIPENVSGIYAYYAEKVLERKFSTQLKLSKDYSYEEDTRKKFLYVMEELALCLQLNNVDSISLEEFKCYNIILISLLLPRVHHARYELG